MTPLLLGLSVYAVVFAVFGTRWLRASERWQRAAPRCGLLLWTALPTTWVIAVLAIGLAATAQLTGGLGLAGLLHACLHVVELILGVHHPPDIPAAIALFGSLIILLRLVWVATRQMQHNRRQRNKHQREVCGGARISHHGRISIINSPTPTAYCVPGRRSAIVLSSATLRELPPRQLHAVIAHEQAHLRGRHHLYIAWGAILARAFPFVPLLRSAPYELARLVEWLADDHAGRHHGRHMVARALAMMATHTSPSTLRHPDTALPATGADTLERARRLVETKPSDASPCLPLSAVLAAPGLVLVATAAMLIPLATADPTPLCQGHHPPAHAQTSTQQPRHIH